MLVGAGATFTGHAYPDGIQALIGLMGVALALMFAGSVIILMAAIEPAIFYARPRRPARLSRRDPKADGCPGTADQGKQRL